VFHHRETAPRFVHTSPTMAKALTRWGTGSGMFFLQSKFILLIELKGFDHRLFPELEGETGHVTLFSY
jgi:hypothetical protein